MNKEIIQQIEKELKQMSLPVHRKTIRGGDSLRWLARNLGINNREHPKFERVMELIKQVIK
jgi:hypothetical protein